MKANNIILSEDKYLEKVVDRNHVIFDNLGDMGDVKILNSGYKNSELHVKKAYGCHIEDFDSNVYIDTALGAGMHILGHAHPVIVEAVQSQVKEGTLYIQPNGYTYEVVKHLNSIIPHFNNFVFCNTGTEASMRAVRIARAFTGKKKIAIFSGSWHGGNDMLLLDEDYSGSAKLPMPMFKSAGIPEELKDLILFLPYNDEAAFELIEKHKDELAMVMIEPSQGSNPRDDVGTFLKGLRTVTAKADVLLCFDEVITGFRLALGGGQQFYGIEADLAMYGKTLGGGFSIGLVAGKDKIMNVVNGDRNGKSVFMGGTFSANPFVMRVARDVLAYLISNEARLYSYFDKNGKYLRDEINGYCIQKNIPLRAMGIASMSRLIFTDCPIKSRRDRDEFEIDDSIQQKFYLQLRVEKRIHINSNRLIFLCEAHKQEHIDRIVEAIKDHIGSFDGF